MKTASEALILNAGDPTVFSSISPTCPAALALIFGVAESDLPWPLQHWFSSEPYDGNCILDRLDPIDWVLRNPWSDVHQYGHLQLDLAIYLSRSGYHARRKALGLPRREIEAISKDGQA